MSGKSKVKLDAGNNHQLSQEEMRVILRAADEIISSGGRSILAKILKGSKDKKVLEHHLDGYPVYGYYSALTLVEITGKIDWMIKNYYLRVEYQGKLPMLGFTEKGWELEKETYTKELFSEFILAIENSTGNIIFQMKDVNRSVVFDLIERIQMTGDKRFIVLLKAWKLIEVRKVREKLDMAINELDKKVAFIVIDGGRKD